MTEDDLAAACVGGHDTRPGCKICRDTELAALIASVLRRAAAKGQAINVAGMHRKLASDWPTYRMRSTNTLHTHLKECEGQA